ncbi:asparagine synthase (glutamine-hydrolysing) [uncultured Gammaproteobacteria bacterium]
MCGMCGLVDGSRSQGQEALLRQVRAMSDTLTHRGPDGEGQWADAEAGVAFGHRRLAIIDLTEAGRQPMASACGRFTVTYNGEIYNYLELRAELEAAGARFRGHSDTEVMVEAFARWGVAATVPRLNGIFAFAAWDHGKRTLWLGRDHLGIKPLYWGRFGPLLLFGSELKALRAHPGFKVAINRDAAAAFFRHNYVPGPHSIYQGVFKLDPGSILVLRPGAEPEIARYWDMRAVANRARDQRQPMSEAEAVDRLEALLKDAVARQMISDVPLGVFLSGGIDSSTVAALAQANSSSPVRTFSIGFHEAAFNEAEHARAVAHHLGTDHTELYVDPKHALELVPRMAEWFDEPFADSSQIPTFMVSELTRKHVTVALSGDGGDELFAGYNRYVFGDSLWRKFGLMPRPLRSALGEGLRSVRPGVWDALFKLVPGRFRPAQAGDKLHKLAEVLGRDGQDALYRRLLTHWDQPEQLVPGSCEPKGILWQPEVAQEVPDFVERMQFLDTVTYLPDDILVKVDRTSMAVALEARVPLLDYRVVEFAWTLPRSMKLRGNVGKWALRQVLYRYVPPVLIDRPKMGFGVPIADWLRGPLRDWAEDLLDPARLAADGLLNPEPIRQKWREHLSGQRNWQYLLWDVLMFQGWRQRWLG